MRGETERKGNMGRRVEQRSKGKKWNNLRVGQYSGGRKKGEEERRKEVMER